jgi:hypothetical protein
MALALEVPLATGHFEPDEHLNLVRDYSVDLHTKLVGPEENRAHMSTYINFQEDALGDSEILGEQDPDYFYDTDDERYPAAKQSARDTSINPLSPWHEALPSEASTPCPAMSADAKSEAKSSARSRQDKRRDMTDRDTREERDTWQTRDTREERDTRKHRDRVLVE